MNINKFTQSSMAAVQNLEKIAADYGNQEIEQEHLLYRFRIKMKKISKNMAKYLVISDFCRTFALASK